MTKTKSPKTLKETFTVDPHQGIAAFVASLQKPGYEFAKLDRKGTTAVVTFTRVDA